MQQEGNRQGFIVTAQQNKCTKSHFALKGNWFCIAFCYPSRRLTLTYRVVPVHSGDGGSTASPLCLSLVCLQTSAVTPRTFFVNSLLSS